MTLLHWEALRKEVERPDPSERLVVMPFLDREEQVGPSSIDLRLGPEFRLLRRTEDAGLDPGREPEATTFRMQESVSVDIGKALWLHPGQFVLGSTFEYLRIPPHLGAYVLGRSSWGRVGLLVATAIMVNPGFRGSLTLELVNQGEGPIALYPGSRIAQLAVHSLPSKTKRPYGHERDKYIGPVEPQVSRLHDEAAEIKKLKSIGDSLNPSQTVD